VTKGYQLENARVQKSLKVEFETYKPDVVVFMRDADGIITEHQKIEKVKEWFDKLNPIVNKKGILLTNIYELEALILADIETFNSMYGTSIANQGNVTYKKEPKEFLMTKTSGGKKVYKESHCPDIFSKLRFDVITKNWQ
jgi:hypothetical protein